MKHVLGVQLTLELELGGLASIRRLLRNWIRLVSIPSDANPARGRSSVRAFNAGAIGEPGHADLVTGLDADVSFGPEYLDSLARSPEGFRADDLAYQPREVSTSAYQPRQPRCSQKARPEQDAGFS
jgi:hypothetical protein